jgi:ergothioneine biosynthesis protein EgtB
VNPDPFAEPSAQQSLLERYQRVRQTTLNLAEPLSFEDMMVQSMPDTSPTRWHLAHTTWFFEHFLLGSQNGYQVFKEGWDFLFNSYYYTVGDMYKRPVRGLLSRPGAEEILAYRSYVDEQMCALIDTAGNDQKLAFLVTLGLNHEQQHQELILTDIKHALSLNPLKPAYREDIQLAATSSSELSFNDFSGGIVEIGTGAATASQYCFDNETPRHRVFLNPFKLANRQVTNKEFKAFIEDQGYQRPELWLSDGWATVQNQQWAKPMYWSDDLNSEFSLLGEIELDSNRSISHMSYFEADAFARWAGARLPTEAEWEHATTNHAVKGNLLEQQSFHPSSAQNTEQGGDDISQLFGDTWEWTQSAYSAYPGFKALEGSLGEYNGKFMCNQLVLRGGSCVTPGDHIRASYRNFFPPEARWQFSGLRLARNEQSRDS